MTLATWRGEASGGDAARCVDGLRKSAKMVSFFPQNHIYEVQKVEYPSVTTIIKAESDVYGEYKKIDPAVLENAAQRGNAVHEAVERSIKEGEPAWVDREDAAPYVDAYNKFMSLGVLTPLCAEIKTYHPDLQFAGTIDIVGLVNGELSIVDIKTTYRLNRKAVRLQLAGYAAMAYFWSGVNPKRYVLKLDRNSGRKFDRISAKYDRNFIQMVESYHGRAA